MAEIKYNLGTLAVVPSGAVIPFAGSTAPQGYLLCDGSAVSRTDYPYLFNAIGTIYGEGDGNTTFNLPNLQDKFIEGAGSNDVGVEKTAGLPNITGEFGAQGSMAVTSLGTGAFRVTKTGTIDAGYSERNHYSLKQSFDASRSSSIYGKSDTVQPPAICMNYIIKY